MPRMIFVMENGDVFVGGVWRSAEQNSKLYSSAQVIHHVDDSGAISTIRGETITDDELLHLLLIAEYIGQ